MWFIIKIRNFFRHLNPDLQNVPLCRYFIERQGKGAGTVIKAPHVLVQCVEDSYYYGLWGAVVDCLRQNATIQVDQFVLRSLNVEESRSIGHFMWVRWVGNTLLNRKWVRAYGVFCDSIAYYASSFLPVTDTIDAIRSWRIWSRLKSRNDLVSLRIDTICVGDLINDSYLRFKPAPTVGLEDIYLWILIWQACREIRRAKSYFSKGRPKLYLTSYSTYIQHGIPVRVALESGVRVYSFGNYQEFAKELCLSDLVHTKNPDHYAEKFRCLSESDQRHALLLADKALSSRLAGGVDSATSYMKKSAYSAVTDEVPDVGGAVVIFMHDFYDSPHVYRDMVFHDFWDWICFTIETLNKAAVPFYIKQHPNQIALSDGALQKLKLRYPNARMIDPSVTNKQLVDAGMVCAVTVYGTVAHEMAYMGVPTIACSHHPHVSFDFCLTAKSEEDYRDFLCNAIHIGKDRELLRHQSLIFYYMHNLDMSEGEVELMAVLGKFRKMCAENASEDILAQTLEEVRQLPAFEQYISKWASQLRGSMNGG